MNRGGVEKRNAATLALSQNERQFGPAKDDAIEPLAHHQAINDGQQPLARLRQKDSSRKTVARMLSIQGRRLLAGRSRRLSACVGRMPTPPAGRMPALQEAVNVVLAARRGEFNGETKRQGMRKLAADEHYPARRRKRPPYSRSSFSMISFSFLARSRTGHFAVCEELQLSAFVDSKLLEQRFVENQRQRVSGAGELRDHVVQATIPVRTAVAAAVAR